MKQDFSRRGNTQLYLPEREVAEVDAMRRLPQASRSSAYLFWHFIVNLIFCLIGLTLLLAILPFMALAIYLDSPGPIFYTQARLGHKGKVFRMYKFRTMHTDAGAADSTVRTAPLDARVTRLGRFLRATHLDELPQILNILRGEMNLVGPRPEQPKIAAMLEDRLPLYRTRLEVKPGLTGLAQVMYRYTSIFEDDAIKLAHDLEYIASQSVLLDIKIILKTCTEVLSGRGK